MLTDFGFHVSTSRLPNGGFEGFISPLNYGDTSTAHLGGEHASHTTQPSHEGCDALYCRHHYTEDKQYLLPSAFVTQQKFTKDSTLI